MGISLVYRVSRAWSALACMAYALAACAMNHTAQVDASEPLPVLVRLAPSENILPTGLLHGRIEVRDGCIDLVSTKDRSPRHTVWPRYYELIVRNGRAIGIHNLITNQFLLFGHAADFGGGEVNTDRGSDLLEAGVPQKCKGKSVIVDFDD